MKKIIIALGILGSLSTYAEDCKVYGISDSPQSLSCNFKLAQDEYKLTIRCEGGRYLMHWNSGSLGTVETPVTSAHHIDVERGNCPLVFETENIRLEALKRNRMDYKAYVRVGSQVLKGKCR